MGCQILHLNKEGIYAWTPMEHLRDEIIIVDLNTKTSIIIIILFLFLLTDQLTVLAIRSILIYVAYSTNANGG